MDILALALAFILGKNVIEQPKVDPQSFWRSVGVMQYEPTHQQIIWKNALEWFESRGVKTAVNPKDKDGTASWCSHQFKPDTVKFYGAQKYKMIPDDLEKSDYTNYACDYAFISEVVNRMLGDKDVKWRHEFPDVVNNKIGLPPSVDRVQ